MDSKTIVAGFNVLVAIAKAIKELGAVESGKLWVQLMQVMTFEEYVSALELLAKNDLIKVDGLEFVWIGD